LVALQKRKIFAAGLDVYEKEPAITRKLLRLENVVLLPHIGSATWSTRRTMAITAAQNLIDVLEGREPRFKVV
jgi:lactate dehydrogenase-like 2-hydroxyacid dehydrogenase